MEQVPTSITTSEDKVLFTWRTIALATFLGGPFAAIYLIARNFTTLGKEEGARYTWIFGVTFELITIPLLFSLPEEFLDKTSILIPQIFGILPAWIVVKRYQLADIESHFASGGLKGSAWKAAGIAFIAAAVYLSLGVGYALVFLEGSERIIPEASEAVVYMERSGCPVYYDSDKIIEADAKVAGATLEMIGYFDCRNASMDAVFYTAMTSIS